jgi:hypothetical protein
MEIAEVTSPPRMPKSGSRYFYCFARVHPKDSKGVQLPDVYLSGRDGRKIICREGVVVFGDPIIDRVPIPGDHIRFHFGNNTKGSVACPWGFADEYDKACSMAGLSASTLYRVVMSIFEHGQRLTKDEVVCEPITLEMLQKKYPIPWKKDTDPFPRKMVYGDFIHKCQFQRQNVSGVWENCEDPRRQP